MIIHKFLIPIAPSSLPYPDFFIPPKGKLESELRNSQKTLPASIFLTSGKHAHDPLSILRRPNHIGDYWQYDCLIRLDPNNSC
jgi:hypothetical protein